jgi:hypothetical protein
MAGFNHEMSGSEGGTILKLMSELVLVKLLLPRNIAKCAASRKFQKWISLIIYHCNLQKVFSKINY